MIKNKDGRGAKLVKAYICVFVCCATKAIHLELVTSLSTEHFMAALRRFISRRGKPSNIYSDNATNFVGACSELKYFLNNHQFKNSIINDLATDAINWNFIPPRSPHFGGQWEAGVKAIKHHLKRVALNASFTYEQYYTLLTQIEAVLNSRPLSPLSPDPEDLNPLTPAHFLVGRNLTAPPEEDLGNTTKNRLTKFKHIQQIQQHFWRRWHKEYLNELQVRTKWKANCAQLLRPGVLVLIKEDNLPPMKWMLGRVQEVHPGSDGVTRVATLQLSNGSTLKRAARNICVLPVSDTNV